MCRVAAAVVAVAVAALLCPCCSGSRIITKPVAGNAKKEAIKDGDVQDHGSWPSESVEPHSAKRVMDVLFMADIGHSREHRDILTDPWPMSKSVNEGAFSLYEGLFDYMLKGDAAGEAPPSAAFILGDVAYCGGDAACLNATSGDFKKYLNEKVPEVFPVIGNHDVNYLGCTSFDNLPSSQGEAGTCYYGAARSGPKSVHEMSFNTWRKNWLEAFPATRRSVILPPPAHNPTAKSQWIAPSRYNVDLDPESKVYFIAGLISGSATVRWNGDTPASAADAHYDPEKECTFLRDSLAHGRRLGKTIFVYLTHALSEGCKDWGLMQEIDVWLYGHHHRSWQSVLPWETQLQRSIHYPLRVLTGNGGFDEGWSKVVSFVRMREEQVVSEGGEILAKLTVDVFDTCTGECVTYPVPHFQHCWSQCKDVEGGYDGNGAHGPRAAVKRNRISEAGFEFLEASKSDRDSARNTSLPTGSPKSVWKLQLDGFWVGLGTCTMSKAQGWRIPECLIPVGNQDAAVGFSLYDVQEKKQNEVAPASRSFLARLAVWKKPYSPVTVDHGCVVQHPYGFYESANEGEGSMVEQRGDLFSFTLLDTPSSAGGTSWALDGFDWYANADPVLMAEDSHIALYETPGFRMEVHFEPSVFPAHDDITITMPSQAPSAEEDMEDVETESPPPASTWQRPGARRAAEEFVDDDGDASPRVKRARKAE